MDLNGTVKTLKNILIAPCSAARRTAAAFVACTFLPDFTTEVKSYINMLVLCGPIATVTICASGILFYRCPCVCTCPRNNLKNYRSEFHVTW